MQNSMTRAIDNVGFVIQDVNRYDWVVMKNWEQGVMVSGTSASSICQLTENASSTVELYEQHSITPIACPSL